MARGAISIDDECVGRLFQDASMWIGLHVQDGDRWMRQEASVGYVVRSWCDAAKRNDPYTSTALRHFVDQFIGVEAFDRMVERGYIVDGDRPRWTGPDRDRRWLRTGERWSTYVVRRGGDGGPVKIGRSSNITKRLAQLQSASAEPVALLHTIAGDVEAELHEKLSRHRVRGEWFNGSPEFYGDLGRLLSRIG
jgi:hypothetical protein